MNFERVRLTVSYQRGSDEINRKRVSIDVSTRNTPRVTSSLRTNILNLSRSLSPSLSQLMLDAVCVCVFPQLVYPQDVKLTEKEVSADPLIFLWSLY